MGQAPESHLDDDDDEISLLPYVKALWRYRQVILVATMAAAVLFVVIATIVVLASPRERVGILQFHLIFSGADSGRYPNGTAFNPAEIVAVPVVSQVFAAHSLDQYASLDEFQQSLSVVPSGPAVRRLDAAYLPQLSNTRLNAAERVRLEDEYLAKRDAVRDGQFDLRLRRKDRLIEMPAPLMETVLSDVLKTWAAQADTQKGGARADVEPVSREMFARAAQPTESYIVRVDVIRTGAQRLLSTLKALQKVPGARTVRTAANRTLGDEVAQVEEILRVDLETLAGLARVAGVPRREGVVINAYLSNQLITNRLALRAASNRAQTLQTVLREYMSQRDYRFDIQPTAEGPTAAGQVSDAFVEKMMGLSAAAQDRELEYRRELTGRLIAASDQAAEATRQIGYYQDLLNQFSTTSAADRTVTADIVSSRFTDVFDRMMEAVDRAEEVNAAVSAQALNPSRQWYSLTVPFRVQTVDSVPMRTVLVWFVLTILVTIIAAGAASLAHHSRSAAAADSDRQPSFQASI